jgi:hypothetical protein
MILRPGRASVGHDPGTAIRAEVPINGFAGVAGILIALQLPLDADRVVRISDDRLKRGPGIALAITAMADSAKGGVARKGVPDTSTQTSSGDVGERCLLW